MAVLSMPAGISAKIQAKHLSGEFQGISGFMGIPELKSGGGRLGICFESEETEDEWVPCLEHYVFDSTASVNVVPTNCIVLLQCHSATTPPIAAIPTGQKDNL